jgi:hypothetical protein
VALLVPVCQWHRISLALGSRNGLQLAGRSVTGSGLSHAVKITSSAQCGLRRLPGNDCCSLSGSQALPLVCMPPAGPSPCSNHIPPQVNNSVTCPLHVHEEEMC